MLDKYLIVFTDVSIRTAVIYGLLIAGIILIGKKELSQLSIIDLVFILLISNSVQNAMVGDNTSLAGGVISGGTLFFLNYVLKRLTYRFNWFSRLVSGQPVLLIHEGTVIEKNCKDQRITMDELRTAVREHGLKNIEDVDIAVLEVDGNISVVSYDEHKKTRFIRKSKKVTLSREH